MKQGQERKRKCKMKKNQPKEVRRRQEKKIKCKMKKDETKERRLK